MSERGEYAANSGGEARTTARALKEIPTESQWWTGVVVDSALGFSAVLVFVLAGILYLRRRYGRDRSRAE
jgi:hypothetical protein